MNKNICLLVAIASVFLFGGCATTKIGLKQDFWQSKNSKIGVAISQIPTAEPYKAGSQGLLDMAINNALASSLKAHLQSMDTKNFSNAIDSFISKLSEKGISAIRIVDPIDQTKLEKYKTDAAGKFTKVDFKPIAAKYGINQLVLLTIDRIGTIRPYYGFIPLGSPAGLCQANGQLINLGNNELLWLYTMSDKESQIPVDGEWNQSPDYPNVDKAVQKAIKNAITVIRNDFSK